MVCRCATKEIHEQRYMDSMNYTLKQREEYNQKKIDKLQAELSALTPDSSKWELVDFLESGSYFIAKVKFQSCEHAGYGGHKILVFKATTKEAIMWRHIDPHFKKAGIEVIKTHAPVPIARFPASPEGWEDAKAFVRIKNDQEKNVGKRSAVFDGFDGDRHLP